MTRTNRLFSAWAISVALAVIPFGGTIAEELQIPVGTQADRDSVKAPTFGVSKASVRATWGNPQQIEGPVGQPPISQWHYEKFVVYFENDRVLHSVLKRQR